MSLWGLSMLCHAQAVALVTDLLGKATLTANGGVLQAAILSDIQTDSQAQVDANATLVVLYLKDGSEYQIKGPAQVIFRGERPEVTNGVPAVLRAAPAGLQMRIKATGVSQAAIVMRSLGSVRIRLLAGNSTLVREPQPELRWAPPLPELRYRVNITDDSGRTVHESEVDGTHITVPPAARLEPGRSYTWDVSARSADGRKFSGRGEFGIVSSEVNDQAAAAYLQAGNSVSAQVALALWLDQQALRDEARGLWRKLALQRPSELQLRKLAER